jgi:DNA-binding beta-propeller fold protein YncE
MKQSRIRLLIFSSIFVSVFFTLPASALEVKSVASIKGHPKEFFSYPKALFLEPDKGRIYVADAGANRLLSFTPELTYLSKFDHNGQLKMPLSLLKDAKGRFYILEGDKGKIILFDVKAKTSRSIPLPGIDNPSAITLSNKGEVFVADLTKGKILSFDGEGSNTREIKLPSELNPLTLTDLFSGGDGNIYAVDPLRRKVFVINSSDGNILSAFGNQGNKSGEMLFPVSVCYIRGMILVADSHRHRIIIFNKEGKFLYEFGRKGFDEGFLNYPIFVRANDKGQIFVVNKVTRRVEVFQIEQ